MRLNPAPVPQPCGPPPRYEATRPVHVILDGPAPDDRRANGHYRWCPTSCGDAHEPWAQMPRGVRSHRIKETRREVWVEVLPTRMRGREPPPYQERRMVGSDGRLRRFEDERSAGGRMEDSYAYPRRERSRGAPPPYDGHTNISANSGRAHHGSHRSNPPTYSQSGTDHSYQYPDEGRHFRSSNFPGSELSHTGTVVRSYPRGHSLQASARAHSRPRRVIEGPGGSQRLRLEY